VRSPADGGAWQLTAGMAGFGAGARAALRPFRALPQLAELLPRSGSWLTSVKVVLGFAEVALAFKFLSNADLVKQWGIRALRALHGGVGVCALGIVLYLFGVIRFPHDSPVKQRSAVRWGFIALFAATTGYLALGFRWMSMPKTFTASS
jgi:thiol:disulfide interchange protein